MDFRTSTKPLYYISKFLCTTAYECSENGGPIKSKSNKIYFFKILMYTITFVGGNFYVADVVDTGNLDEIAFLLANLMLTTLSIYVMVWSIVSQEKQLKLLNKLQGHNIKLIVWIEVIFVIVYYTSMAIAVAFISSFDVVLVAKYAIFFVLPDVVNYTVLFQFINAVFILRQKLTALNTETTTSKGTKDLKILAQSHHDIYLLSVKIKKFYGLFCLWITATFFLWIMCDLYRFVNVIIVAKHDMDETLASSIIATIAHYSSVLGVAAVCNSTKMESKRFKTLFSRAILLSGNRKTTKENRLSLTLIHQNISFSALDWFELDYLLFYSMSGSIITYLVVLQQLNLS